MSGAREICVTGAGLLSPLGETPAQWLGALSDPAEWRAQIDAETYAPFLVHNVREYDLGHQVPKPGDQRAMGPMMQYGVYAAGLALDDAGIKGDEAALAETHLVVAAGGGERDWELDEQILELLEKTNQRESVLNQQLADGLRPTLFLAQLPNLFGGNISIVHGVTGSSRTFMGEESAGIDAMRVACQRITTGQGDRVLVGGTFSAGRPDFHFMYHSANVLFHEGEPPEIWARPDAGLIMGSAGAFLMLEARETAEARGAKILAVVKGLESGRSRRGAGDATARAERQIEALGDSLAKGTPVLSGASGRGGVTREEHDFLAGLQAGGRIGAVRATARAVGHAIEAAFLQNMVLAVATLESGTLFPPVNPGTKLETEGADDPSAGLLVTSWGHWRGEGLALLGAA